MKKKKVKMIVTIVVSVLALIIILQNVQSVETKLLFITLRMPQAFLLLLIFLLGFVVGAISAMRSSKS